MNKKNKDIIDDNTKFSGTGTETVYVYTFESLVERKNRKGGMIKMKIGMTTQLDPYDRIKQQIGASGHEKIVLISIYKTNNGYKFESNIHNKLKKMGRHITKRDAVGTEWFWVKEKEINRLLNESNKEVEKEYPSKSGKSKSSSGIIKLIMLACFPLAVVFVPAIGIPALIVTLLAMLSPKD